MSNANLVMLNLRSFKNKRLHFMETFASVYFDGTSSIAYPVIPKTDDRLNSLFFETTEHGKMEWEFSQIRFETYDDILEIRHPKFPAALLKISDRAFIDHFLDLLNRKGHVGWYHKLLHQSVAFYITATFLFVVVVILSYIYVVPFAAEKSVSLIPDSFDHYISQSFITDYWLKNDLDKPKSEVLNQFAAHIDFGNYKPLNFSVVNSSQVNAFALPDGNIVVFSALLKKIDSYDELVGLLAHEAVHVNERHGLKMLARNLAGYIFISLIFSDVNGIMAVITENAHNLQALSYSRRFEREADQKGVQLRIKNGINPKGMLRLFERLKEEDSEYMMPEFMSSHPLTSHRIEMINNYISNQDYSVSHNNKLEKLFRKLKK